MSRIVLNIRDEQKAKRLLAHLMDLDYVETQVEASGVSEKSTKGALPVQNTPKTLRGRLKGRGFSTERYFEQKRADKELEG